MNQKKIEHYKALCVENLMIDPEEMIECLNEI